MIDPSQCETCESLAHELAEVKRENEQLRAILSDKSLEEMRIAAYNTSQAGKVAAGAKSDVALRYTKTQLAVYDRLFAQHQALVEFPLKLEHMKAKIANLTSRTDLDTTEKRLKEEKIKDLQAGRLLKEQQDRFLEAVSLVLERFARGDEMVEADFEVLDHLEQIGGKIPALLAKNLKKT